MVFSERLKHVQFKVLFHHILLTFLGLRESEVGLVTLVGDNGHEFLLAFELELLDNSAVEVVRNTFESIILLLLHHVICFPIGASVCEGVEVCSHLLLEVC